MAIQFPYQAVAGAAVDPAESEAANLYANLCWVARLADEMDADTELDLKRVMQLVLHCRKFRVWYEALQTRGVAARPVIEGVLAAKKITWPTRAEMLADLSALYADCGTLADWIEANAAGYKAGYAKTMVVGNEIDGTPIISDVAEKAAKPVAFGTRISALRARFGAKA